MINGGERKKKEYPGRVKTREMKEKERKRKKRVPGEKKHER